MTLQGPKNSFIIEGRKPYTGGKSMSQLVKKSGAQNSMHACYMFVHIGFREF